MRHELRYDSNGRFFSRLTKRLEENSIEDSEVEK